MCNNQRKFKQEAFTYKELALNAKSNLRFRKWGVKNTIPSFKFSSLVN